MMSSFHHRAAFLKTLSEHTHIDHVWVAIGHVHYGQNDLKWPKMAILAILYMANGNPDMVNMGMS